MAINKIFNADIVDGITTGENAAVLVNNLKSTINLLVDSVNNGLSQRTTLFSNETGVADLDLEALTGGYPGDGLYVVTIKVNTIDVTVLMYFTDNIHTQVTPIVGVDSVQVYKDSDNLLSHYNADSIIKLEKIFG